MKAKFSFLSFLCLALLLALPPQLAYSQIKVEFCPVCQKPKQNCPYKMNHPKCATCGKVKEQCPYKGNHPKCATCGKVKEQCPYKGNHPKCNSCGKLKEQCPYNGNHPTTGTLSITSTPSGAVVKIDGKYKGETQLTLEDQKPGTYSITFSAEGYETQTKSVTVTAGKTVTCSATLKKRLTFSSSSDGTFTLNGISFKMVRVEGGTFQMGSNDGSSAEKPVHEVTVSRFSIGATEVTQELWEAVMGSNPSYFKGSKRPVEKVSWNDCQTFITKLNQLTGKTFRLPTEAEWEYAARGGNKSKGYTYSGSNTIDNVAWYTVNCYDKGESSPDYGTHDVATKAPNELGIYDMSGNVWEWCQDWYGSDYYSSTPSNNPTGPSSGSKRVKRGGSWREGAWLSRVSIRLFDELDYPRITSGLRLAL